VQPPDDWSDWISAADIYHWCAGNPLIDWFNRFGKAAGFVADSRRPGYDRRFDYLSFVVKQSWAFKRAVLRELIARSALRTITTSPSQARDPAKFEQTLAAIKLGIPIIVGPVLWSRNNRTASVPDLIVRSDRIAHLIPAAFAGEPPGAAEVSAPAIGAVPYHYRVVEIKFLTLHLLKDGSPSTEHGPNMAQNSIYNDALGEMQGYTPPASYICGRDDFAAAGRVNHADPELRRIAAEGAAWVRRLRKDGASWHPLPVPTVPELRPNMRADRDQEWHAAKQEIAEAQHDLTLLPYVGPERRALAEAAGITRWDDPRLTASVLGFSDSIEGRRLDAILAANRSSATDPVVPARITSNVGGWQQPAPLECYVMAESVNDQDDDFNELPDRGGTPMVFMITWGWLDRTGEWQSRQLIARDLSPSAETDMKAAWQAELTQLADSQGVKTADIRLFHWGPLHHLEGRVGAPFDLLENLIHKEPVAVRGAFSFGMADIARALHSLGLIDTVLPAVPLGTLEAMAGAWSSAHEAKRLEVGLEETDSMQLIGRFSSAACASMMEILTLLRHRAHDEDARMD
jgi:hypothetical protein